MKRLVVFAFFAGCITGTANGQLNGATDGSSRSGVADRVNVIGSGLELVHVPGGCFRMGDAFGDGDADERPLHEVCLDDFRIGRYEVTQSDWVAVIGSNPSHFAECGGNCPVEQVSWEDAQQFLFWLNDLTGRQYRLPTEAEWEFAARSGGKKERFSGGADPAVGWHQENAEEETHPVGLKAPNGLGLYDMSGNVWEWVQDWKLDAFYSLSPKKNPQGPNCTDRRVMRGGSWSGSDWMTRTAYRGAYAPGFGSKSFGLRLAESAGAPVIVERQPIPASAKSAP